MTFKEWLEANRSGAGRKPVYRDDEILVWTDVETTGLVVGRDPLIEIGAIMTDTRGLVIGDPFLSLVRPSGDAGKSFATMQDLGSEYVFNMHSKSGLWRDLYENWEDQEIAAWKVESKLGDWMTSFLGPAPERKHPLAGSSVAFDRDMIAHAFPVVFDEFLTYRTIDASGIREVQRRVNPSLTPGSNNPGPFTAAHRPLEDLANSIELYKFLLAEFLWTEENAEGIGSILPLLGKGDA